jgi:hypothetical protein
LEKFTDHTKSMTLDNKSVFRLLKGLLMYKRFDLAQSLVNRLDLENISNFDDKIFLRDNFEIDVIGDR